MNIKNIKIHVAVILLSLVYSVDSPAMLANGSGSNIGIDGTMTTPDFYMSVTQPVTTAISLLSTSIQTAVRNLSMTVEATGKAQMAHIEKIHEADRSNQLEIERQKVITQRSMNGAYLPAGNTCADRTAAATGSVTDQTVAYQSARYGNAMRVRASKAPDAREQLYSIAKNHEIYYCDKKTDPLQCNGQKQPGKTVKTTDGDMPMPDGDTSAKSLFDGAGDDKHLANLTFTQGQEEAANAFINNMIDSGDTPRALSPAEAVTSEGQIYQGLKLAYESRIDMSRMAMANILAARTHIADSDNLVKAMQDTIPANDYGMKDYLDDRVKKMQKYSPSFNDTTPISPMELLDIQVKMRSDNAGWMTYINNAERDQVAKEQAIMTSLLLRIQYMQLRNQEVQVALQAVASAESAKANMIPRINAAAHGLSNN